MFLSGQVCRQLSQEPQWLGENISKAIPMLTHPDNEVTYLEPHPGARCVLSTCSHVVAVFPYFTKHNRDGELLHRVVPIRPQDDVCLERLCVFCVCVF